MYTFRAGVGSTRAKIIALGPQDAHMVGVGNWSLKGLQRSEDIPANKSLVGALRTFLLDFGITRAYAPNVAASSGRVVPSAKLTNQIPLSGGVLLKRNKELPADGISLRPEQAFVMSAAGCPVILASAGKHMIVAHAGRDSLIDRGAVTGNPSRPHASIVDAIAEEFRQGGQAPEKVHMLMMFAIPPDRFVHSETDPVYGKSNRALLAFAKRWDSAVTSYNGLACLDLERVFLEQTRQAGVQHAYAICRLDDCPDLAHTRDGRGSHHRNLVIVKRVA